MIRTYAWYVRVHVVLADLDDQKGSGSAKVLVITVQAYPYPH